jgi:hypothetical protein
LGGGAVLFRETALADLLPAAGVKSDPGLVQQTLFRFKAALYNRMLAPRLYWIPAAMPFLGLGKTHYRPLVAIDPMDSARLTLLPANINAYWEDDMGVQTALSRMLGEADLGTAGILDLAVACALPSDRRLLRYPLLVDAAERDRLFSELRRRGLGASRMYPATLPGIPGLERLLAGQGPFPAAEAFAARILTLPTHRRVSRRDIEEMRQVLVS